MAKAIDRALKAELVAALGRAADQEVLLDIVRAFKAKGGAQRIAYDTLEALMASRKMMAAARIRYVTN